MFLTETILIWICCYYLQKDPKISAPVCEEHGICFCEECVQYYKDTDFNIFNNRCMHFDAQCMSAYCSDTYINRLGFVFEYAQVKSFSNSM